MICGQGILGAYLARSRLKRRWRWRWRKERKGVAPKLRKRSTERLYTGFGSGLACRSEGKSGDSGGIGDSDSGSAATGGANV